MTKSTGAGTLRLVLGDQLSDGLAGLADLDPARDVVLMAEVEGETGYVRHHKQKIALVLAGMRAFAARLGERDVAVRYVQLDDPDNRQSIISELARAVEDLAPARIVITEPGEWRLAEEFRKFAADSKTTVEVREDDRFICGHDAFRRWAEGRRQLRKRLPPSITPPSRMRCPPNEPTREVIAMVQARFEHHFGGLDAFGWPVTYEQAEAVLADFLKDILPGFGDWQDAMSQGETFMWHGLISTALNMGLLDPLDVCRRAEAEYREGRAPLNAVEGFIRQILGWREFVRGVYWLKTPEYRHRNHLDADRRLPWFFWTGETDMACVADVVQQVRRHAYAHHIQRLMVTGNLAMLLGVHPDEVDEWYMVVFADAYEWVEMPNTRGMATFADGGIVGSKPYAASGAYIDRMSDYCSGCAFDVKAKTGPKACPFNRLYWGFLERNRVRLRDNPRLAMPYRTLDRWTAEQRAALVREADEAREVLGASALK
jgi:deoxyribodipyrimidine photolyase-related protein